MKGIVVHYQGKVRRTLEGQHNKGRLEVRVVNPIPSLQTQTAGGRAPQHPVYFVFELDGRPVAASRNVVLVRGRRYPEVEHWFVMPDTTQQLHAYDPRQISAQAGADESCAGI